MKRLDYIAKLQERIQSVPVVALLGPRQCGKTTLSRQFAEEWEATKKSVTRFDLEDPTDLAKLQNPKMALENLSGLILPTCLKSSEFWWIAQISKLHF